MFNPSLNTGKSVQSRRPTREQSPDHSCSDFTIGYRVHSSGWPVRIAALHDAVESARSVGAHYEDGDASREVGL